MVSEHSAQSTKSRFTASVIRSFEKIIPDPFVLAILITLVIAVLCFFVAPDNSLTTMASGWGTGFFSIMTFTAQITLVLMTGHAFAHAPIIQNIFRSIVSLAKTPVQAAALTFICVALCSFFNWSFGLVMSALLAREVAKRHKADFAWIVAAGFSGWVVWASGISSSIALAQSTPGSAMNVVEKLTGKVLSLSEFVFVPFNLVPTIFLIITVPFLLAWIKPSEKDSIIFDAASNPDPKPHSKPEGKWTFAQWLEYSWVGSAFVAIIGFIVWYHAYIGTLKLEGINAVIFMMFVLGIILHGYPLAYARAIKNAAAQTSSMLLQYPLYGGIMGLMAATGLPQIIANGFIAISTDHTLPFWSYICSVIVTFLIPSGGGHWAVQGPFIIPAAIHLNASIPATTMAVAMGEQVSNMLQPFWAAPVVAMAGIGVQRVLGYTLMTFILSFIVYGAALLFLV